MDRTPTNFYIAILASAAVLSGCDSGGGKGSDTDVPAIPEPAPTIPMVTISGVVEKGPFQQMQVNAWGMDGNGQRTPLPAEVNGNGYSVSAPEGNIVYLEASGTFTNELTGEQTQLQQPLRAITPADGRPQNINLFTDIAARFALGRNSANPDEALILDSERRLLSALGLPENTDPGSLSINDLPADTSLGDADLQLLLVSAYILDLGRGQPGLGDAYNDLLSKLEEGTYEPQDLFGFLNGMDPIWLLNELEQAGVLANLPQLNDNDLPVLVCNPVCGWSAPAAPSVSISDASVWEADGTGYLRISRTGTDLGELTLSLLISGGSASPDEDYLLPPTQVVLGATDRTLDLPLELVIDTLAESSETITLQITDARDSGGNAVTVARASATLTVLNGAPATAGTAHAPDAFCITHLAPAITMPLASALPEPMSNACAGSDFNDLFIASEEPLLRLALGMTDSCGQSCDDQLLDLTLSYTDPENIRQTLSLGQYRFPGSSVAASGNAVSETLLVRLSDPATRAFLQAAASADDLALSASHAQNEAASVTIATGLLALPDNLTFGDRVLEFATPTRDSATGCPAGSIALADSFQFFAAANAAIPAQSIAGSACVSLSDLTPAQPVPVSEAEIDISSLFLELPEWHFSRFDSPQPLVGKALATQALGVFLWNPLALAGTDVYLGAEHLPFMYRIGGVLLTENGLQLAYQSTRLRSDAGFAADDPRLNNPLSNLAPYASAQSGRLTLAIDGIYAETQFNAGTATTAYPKGELSWSGFSASVNQGEAGTSVTDIGFSLNQYDGCGSASCQGNGERSHAVTVTAASLTSAGIYGQGVLQQTDGLAWGNGPAWSAPQTAVNGAGITLHLPGNARTTAQNNQQSSAHIADLMQAHRDADTHYLRGSSDFTRGNHFPPGITLGPQWYADDNGQPDSGAGSYLNGQSLSFISAQGQLDLNANNAAKWVIRNDGISGVFNADPATLPASTNLNGYDFSFRRFAVRARANQVDDFNWVDGATALYGDAGGDSGMDIRFSNLILDCGGRLGRSRLDDNQCSDGICQLASWRADAALLDMNFNRSTEQCDNGGQTLELGLEAQFLALNEPLFLSSEWAPDGSLLSSSVRALDSYVLDQRGDYDGFPLQLSDAALSAPIDITSPESVRYGTLALQGRVALPFWNALESDARLANTLSFGLPAAEPSLLLPSGELAGLSETQRKQLNNDLIPQLSDSDAYDFDARYEWGDTGFGFQLPVYYSLTGPTDQATFLGRTLGKDLYVLEASAGIDFIEPVRTKLSFGASADFEKLREVRFQVELGKGEGLSKVDDLLVTTGVVEEPIIEPTFGVVNRQVERVNEFAGRGMDELLERALLEGLERGGEALAPALPTNEDPFVTLASGLSRLRAVPDQIVSLLDETLFDPLGDTLANAEDQLRTPLQQVVADINAMGSNDPVPAQVYDTLDNADAILSQLETQLRQPFDRVETLEAQINERVREASNLITRSRNSLTEVTGILEDVTNIAEAQCSSSGTLGAEVNGYLDAAFTGVSNLRTLSSALQSAELLGVMAELAASDPQVQESLIKAQQTIQGHAEEVASKLSEAEEALRTALCSNDPATLLGDALNMLLEINAGITTIDNAVSQVQQAMVQVRSFRRDAEEQILQPLTRMQQALADVRTQLESFNDPAANGAALLALIDEHIGRATDDQITCIAPHAGNPGCQDVVALVLTPATELLNQARSEAVAAVTEPFREQLPMAYMSAPQLRQLIVSQVMNSQPVSELRRELNARLVEVTRQLQEALLTLTDKANEAVQVALQSVENAANEALAEALAPVKDIPLNSASLDGFGTIAGNELERAHLGAEWTMRPASEGESGNSFGAALDIVSWAANNKAAGCASPGAGSNLDVTISAFNIPANIGESKLNLAKVYLGFTLDGPQPIGVAGGLRAEGEIKFTEFQIYDPAFAAGLGREEVYLGAAAGAVFSAIQAEVAFLAGKTCNQEVLMDLDPQVAQYIPLPETGFAGAYVRGAASIPVYSNGCPLTIGAAADIGAWVLAGPPITLGGLVGGGAYGKVACVGALRGQIRALGSVNADGDMSFVGEGFGVAGLGLCEPAGWTSVERSRKDSFCGTGDAVFRAGYINGWSIMEMSVSAIH